MKKLLLVAGVVGGITLGEYFQPYHALQETYRYHQVPIAKNAPQDPWNYTLQRELVEQKGTTYQGLYLVNEKQGIHKQIDEEGCTCGIDNTIDDFMYDTKQWFQEKVEKTKEWFAQKKR